MSLDSNSNFNPQQPKISNYEKFISYVSKGAEIGQTALSAEKKDSRMRAMVEAPNIGDKLSGGAKFVNFVYLGLIAAPALATYKFTDSIFKYFDKRTLENNLQEKTDIQKGINSLFNSKLNLQAQMKTCDPNDLQTLQAKLDVVQKKLEKNYEQLDLVDNKLDISYVIKDKERFLSQKSVIEATLKNGYFVKTEGGKRSNVQLDEATKGLFQNLHQKLTLEFISTNENAINTYEMILVLRAIDPPQRPESEDLKKTDHLSDAQIKNLVKEHKEAKKEIVSLHFNYKDQTEKNTIKSNVEMEMLEILKEIKSQSDDLEGFKLYKFQANENAKGTGGSEVEKEDHDRYVQQGEMYDGFIDKTELELKNLNKQLGLKNKELGDVNLQLENLNQLGIASADQDLLFFNGENQSLTMQLKNVDTLIEEKFKNEPENVKAILREKITENLMQRRENATNDVIKELTDNIETLEKELQKTKQSLLQSKRPLHSLDQLNYLLEKSVNAKIEVLKTHRKNTENAGLTIQPKLLAKKLDEIDLEMYELMLKKLENQITEYTKKIADVPVVEDENGVLVDLEENNAMVLEITSLWVQHADIEQKIFSIHNNPVQEINSVLDKFNTEITELRKKFDSANDAIMDPGLQKSKSEELLFSELTIANDQLSDKLTSLNSFFKQNILELQNELKTLADKKPQKINEQLHILNSEYRKFLDNYSQFDEEKNLNILNNLLIEDYETQQNEIYIDIKEQEARLIEVNNLQNINNEEIRKLTIGVNDLKNSVIPSLEASIDSLNNSAKLAASVTEKQQYVRQRQAQEKILGNKESELKKLEEKIESLRK